MPLRLVQVVLLSLSLIALATEAGEKSVNRCVGPDGREYFSNRPCPGVQEQLRLRPLSELNPVPADPLRGWVAAYRELARRLGLAD